MTDLRGREWDRIPTTLRWAFVGGGATGLAGGVAGLVVGLEAYPPTAWFAVFELGVPAGLAGGLLAGGAGLVRSTVRRSR